VSINLGGGNRSSEKSKREEVVMANEWLTDARKIPDEVMSYNEWVIIANLSWASINE
jgi:hypothetical protein